MSRQPRPCRQCGLAQFAFTREVNVCIPYCLPDILLCALTCFCLCLSRHQREKQASLATTCQGKNICLADVRGRSSSFAPSHPSLRHHGARSCHGPVWMGDAETHTGFLIKSVARNTCAYTCTLCPEQYLCCKQALSLFTYPPSQPGIPRSTEGCRCEAVKEVFLHPGLQHSPLCTQELSRC